MLTGVSGEAYDLSESKIYLRVSGKGLHVHQSIFIIPDNRCIGQY